MLTISEGSVPETNTLENEVRDPNNSSVQTTESSVHCQPLLNQHSDSTVPIDFFKNIKGE